MHTWPLLEGPGSGSTLWNSWKSVRDQELRLHFEAGDSVNEALVKVSSLVTYCQTAVSWRYGRQSLVVLNAELIEAVIAALLAAGISNLWQSRTKPNRGSSASWTTPQPSGFVRMARGVGKPDTFVSGTPFARSCTRRSPTSNIATAAAADPKGGWKGAPSRLAIVLSCLLKASRRLLVP